MPGQGVAVGTTAGYILMLSPSGDPARTARVDGEVTTMLRIARTGALAVGTATGVVAELGL